MKLLRGVLLGICVATLAASPAVTAHQAAGVTQPPQEQTTGYICPMHPSIVSANPGKCELCGMALVPGDPMATAYYKLQVDVTPRAIKPAAKARVTFNVFHPLTGARVTDYAEVHDRRYHLFIISRDLKYFAHEHPTAQKDGSWTIDVTLPQPGHYLLLSDFLPTGGGPQMISTPLVTAGYDGDLTGAVPKLEPDLDWTKTANGVKLELTIAKPKLFAGEEVELPFQFTDERTGEPIRDLQRYLGAFAHGLIVSEDLVDHIHTHPHEMLEGTDVQSGGGPEVVFDAFFPRAGRYRAWIQFQRNDRLSTVTFTLDVPAFSAR